VPDANPGVDEPSLLIFGGSNVDVYQSGRTNVNYLDDLWSYGLESHVWTQVSVMTAKGLHHDSNTFCKVDFVGKN
jgi:hypothetical protein